MFCDMHFWNSVDPCLLQYARWNEYSFWFLDCGLHIYHSNLRYYNAIAPPTACRIMSASSEVMRRSPSTSAASLHPPEHPPDVRSTKQTDPRSERSRPPTLWTRDQISLCIPEGTRTHRHPPTHASISSASTPALSRRPTARPAPRPQTHTQSDNPRGNHLRHHHAPDRDPHPTSKPECLLPAQSRYH